MLHRGAKIPYFLLSLSVLLLTVDIAHSDGRSFTIEDNLKFEHIPGAMISPGGEFLLFEHTPPYDELNSYEYGITSVRYLSRIYVLDLRLENAQPALLMPEQAADGYWLGNFSPDGRKVSIYSVDEGIVRLNIYNLERKELVELPYSPYVSDVQDIVLPNWISDSVIAYQATEGIKQSFGVSGRKSFGTQLWRGWNRAWNGEAASVRVSKSSPAGMRDGQKELSGKLVIANTEDGRPINVVEGFYSSITVSPNMLRLAALKHYETPQPKFLDVELDYQMGRLQPVMIDLMAVDSVKSLCRNCDSTPFSLQWSHDSDKIAFFARKSGERVETGSYYVFDTVSQDLDQIGHENLTLGTNIGVSLTSFRPEPARPHFYGDGLAIYARDNNNGNSRSVSKFDWHIVGKDGVTQKVTEDISASSFQTLFADKDSIYLLVEGNLWRSSINSGMENLTKEISAPLSSVPSFQSRSPIRATAASGIILESFGNDPKAVLFNLQTNRYFTVKKPDPFSRILDISSPARAALFVTMKSNNESVLVLIYEDGTSREIMRVNKHLIGVEEPVWKSLHYKAGAEERISCMLLPLNWSKKKQYPVIVNVYPDSAPGCANPNYAERNRIASTLYFHAGLTKLDHYLASNGYIVLSVASPDHALVNEDGPFQGWQKVVDDAVDAAIEQGFADPDRMGLHGFSNGGMPVLWLVTQTGRFKAAVSGNGSSNTISHYLTLGANLMNEAFPEYDLTNAGYIQYESNTLFPYRMSAPLWKSKDSYLTNNPILYADQISTPVMMFSSDMDGGFPAGEYDQMYGALYRNGVEALYLRYLGEGHGPVSPPNVRHLWAQTLGWYDKHLKGRDG